jgi:hypothetical protein
MVGGVLTTDPAKRTTTAAITALILRVNFRLSLQMPLPPNSGSTTALCVPAASLWPNVKTDPLEMGPG